MTLRGVEEITRALDPDRAMVTLKKGLRDAAYAIQRAAVKNVSNRVLHRRTGNLATSIKAEIDSDGLAATVGVGKQAEYGRAHEFGVTTKPHMIRPRQAAVAKTYNIKTRHATLYRGGVLRFPIAFGIKSHKATKFAFATHVHHPGSVIPKRPWLLPAYESNKDRIVSTFQASLQRSLTP